MKQDVSSDAKLLVYCRYIFNGSIKKEFLYQNFKTMTKASDVKDVVSAYYESGVELQIILSVITDGASSMFSSRSGFQIHVKGEHQALMFTVLFIVKC